MLYIVHTAAAQSLVQLVHDAVDNEAMSQFVQTFLLESNSTAVRWQAHELLYSMHKYVLFPYCTWILKFQVCGYVNYCEKSHLESCLFSWISSVVPRIVESTGSYPKKLLFLC